jgi:hypothetical protein
MSESAAPVVATSSMLLAGLASEEAEGWRGVS